jgi:hypothetical protein
MIKRLLAQIFAATLGLWLATLWIPGVIVRLRPDSNFFGFPITSAIELFLEFGIILGLLNYFGKLFLGTFSLPLYELSVEILSAALCIGFLFLLDQLFAELSLLWWRPLCYTGIAIWLLNLLIEKLIIV